MEEKPQLSKIFYFFFISYVERKLEKEELKVQGGLFENGTSKSEEKQERAKGGSIGSNTHSIYLRML